LAGLFRGAAFLPAVFLFAFFLFLFLVAIRGVYHFPCPVTRSALGQFFRCRCIGLHFSPPSRSTNSRFHGSCARFSRAKLTGS
jgi:hypothetical protein